MLLELKEVTKVVNNQTHIYPTSLKLESGIFNILLGTTGSGKTTLMQIMAGLETINNGSIYFNNKDVTNTNVKNRNISMVYQAFINYPNFSVFDNIASPLRVAKLPAAEIKKQVYKIAELLKLSPMLDRKPTELSGGQQQRTAIARALVKDSSLILLDEPLANLDYKLREELRDELPLLLAKRNCIIIYSTTEPLEALLLGGNTATLHQGKVTQFGATEDVYQKPKDITSAQIFSEPLINLIPVIKKGNKLTVNSKMTGSTINWTIKDKTQNLKDGRYTFGIRPHHITIKPKKESTKIVGKVEISEISGSGSVIHFVTYEHQWIAQTSGIFQYNVGDKVEFYMDLAEGLLFNENDELALK